MSWYEFVILFVIVALGITAVVSGFSWINCDNCVDLLGRVHSIF